MVRLEHDWEVIGIHSIWGPGNSRDIYAYCNRCGSVKHDYRYGVDSRSPNYPVYYTRGSWAVRAGEPPCALCLLPLPWPRRRPWWRWLLDALRDLLVGQRITPLTLVRGMGAAR